MSSRIVTCFDDRPDETLKTLMAYTYGHTIPLTVHVHDETITLRVDESIPDRLLEDAKQICQQGYKRYHNNL